MLIRDLLRSMRPPQWIKNLFLFAAPIFGRAIGQGPVPAARTTAAFSSSAALSSALYLVNDVIDAEEDRIHPRKSKRPIAAGRLGRAGLDAAALLAAAGLAAAPSSTAASSWPRPPTCFSSSLFAACSSGSSSWTSFSSPPDSSCAWPPADSPPASRPPPGCSSARRSSPFSWPWASGATNSSLWRSAARHRSVLGEYNARLLDQMIAVVTAATAVAYALYCMSGETVRRFGSEKLLGALRSAFPISSLPGLSQGRGAAKR